MVLQDGPAVTRSNDYIEAFGDLPIRPAVAVFVRLSEDRSRFIRQLGVEDVILCGTTFRRASGTREDEFAFDELTVLRNQIEDAGLGLFAIENVLAHLVGHIILGGD